MRLPCLAVAALTAMLVAACSSAAPSPQAAQVPLPSLQLGVDLDFYATPRTNIVPTAQQDIAYIKSLHANAVSISFPLHSDKAGTVIGPLAKTPSVAQLNTLITMAENAHLAVTVRPLLNQDTLGKARVHWKPAHLAAWFAAYRNFLLPYVALAQRDHVAVFVIGTELNAFANAAGWTALRDAISAQYHGQLAFSNNWLGARTPSPGLRK